MRKACAAAGCLLLALAVGRAAWALPDIEELLKTLDRAAAELKTYSYEFSYEGRSFPHGCQLSGRRVGQIVRTERGSFPRYREDAAGVEAEDCPGCRAEIRRKCVCDGEFEWLETSDDRSPRKEVRKSRVTDQSRHWRMTFDHPILTTRARHEHDVLRVTGELVFNDEAVWVLTSTKQHPPSEEYPTTYTYYVGKKDGFVRRSYTHVKVGSSGQYTFETVYHDICVNPDVYGKTFEYTPPDGARITDATGRAK